MAVVLCALLAQSNVIVAPMDCTMPVSKLREARRQLQCTAVVTTTEIYQRIWYYHHPPTEQEQDGSIDWSFLKDIRTVTPQDNHKAGSVTWKCEDFTRHQQQEEAVVTESPLGNGFSSSTKMLLRTSGTTQVPKVVALSATHLLHAAAGLAVGLKLQNQDICCNAMSLFHIGGISTSLLAVLVSGGSVIMMPGPFTPSAFLERLQSSNFPPPPTWYYAGPTMHQALLLTVQAQGLQKFPNHLRLIRSATAPLPKTTAFQLARVFDTDVYETYGMTEAMPICIPRKPTVSAKILKNGAAVETTDMYYEATVGPPLACSLAIVDAVTKCPLPYGQTGEIAVLGPAVIPSYFSTGNGNTTSTVTHTPEGWLLTGDVGTMEPQTGNLYIVGRSKEMIKRGGKCSYDAASNDGQVLKLPFIKSRLDLKKTRLSLSHSHR
jgi:acyl-CoA synthetase (AMP-forming)/AMP-acid ligase II